jgi:hypothetical protein
MIVRHIILSAGKRANVTNRSITNTAQFYTIFQNNGKFFVEWCKISLVAPEISMTDAVPKLAHAQDKEERNWLPLAMAAAVVLLVAGGAILGLEHRSARGKLGVMPISAPLDPYAGSLALTRLALSESSNLVGGKVTYLDGQISNQGEHTVTAVTVQVLFRDFAHEVAQNESQPLKLIRVREPYIDVEPVSAAPLKPGDVKEFRLIFDSVKPDWDGAFPEIRILHVVSK